MLPTFDPILSHTLAATLAIILGLGAWAKLRDPIVFRETLANYELLPDAMLGPVARALPLAEAAAAALLLPLATRATGAWLALAVVGLVTLGVLLALAQGRGGIDCGCGGEQDLPLGPGLVLRNGVVMGLLALTAAPIAARGAVWLDYPAIVAATLFGLGTWTLANTLLAQQPRLLALRNHP